MWSYKALCACCREFQNSALNRSLCLGWGVFLQKFLIRKLEQGIDQWYFFEDVQFSYVTELECVCCWWSGVVISHWYLYVFLERFKLVLWLVIRAKLCGFVLCYLLIIYLIHIIKKKFNVKNKFAYNAIWLWVCDQTM